MPAAAAGVLSPLAVAFGWTHGPGSSLVADDATGRLVLTTTGQEGQPMELYAAEDRQGGLCTSLLLPEQPVADRLVDAGCTSGGGQKEVDTLGIDLQGSGTAAGWVEVITAPGAASLTVSDGTATRRLPVVRGLSADWLPRSELDRPLVLTSYRADGRVLHRQTFVQGFPRGKTACTVPTVAACEATLAHDEAGDR